MQIAVVMVSAADGNLLRNSSRLSVSSCFDDSAYSLASFPDVVIIYASVFIPLMLLNVANAYQIITFRLMLRTTRWKSGSCLSFLQIEKRKFLSMLLVATSYLSIAMILPVQKTQGRKHRKDNAVYFVERLTIAVISVISFVTIASFIHQKIRACAGRQKLRVVAQNCKHSSEIARYQERISPSDGNCLFHALAASKTRDQVLAMQLRAGCHNDALHALVRREIIDYLRACCGHLCVGNTGMSLRDYVEVEMKGVSFDR